MKNPNPIIMIKRLFIIYIKERKRLPFPSMVLVDTIFILMKFCFLCFFKKRKRKKKKNIKLVDKNHNIYNIKTRNTKNLFNLMEKKKILPARFQVGQRGEMKNIANNCKVRNRNNEIS